RRNASSTSANVHGLGPPCRASLSALAWVFGGLTLAALPARGFFTAALVLAALLAAFLAAFPAGFLVVFFAVFLAMIVLILSQNDRADRPRQRPRRRAHAFFGDHHAASLAIGQGFCRCHGACRRHELRRRHVLFFDGRVAGNRLPRP